MKKKKSSLEAVRQRYGYTFVAHWGIGLIMFFIVPLISSVIYAFSEVTIGNNGVESDMIGVKHFISILKEDPNYLDNLRDSLGSIFYSLPIIVSLSLILAVVLNQNFKGRTFFRGIFFMPVIIVSSVVIVHMQSTYVNAPLFTISSSDGAAAGGNLIDFESMLMELNLPAQITEMLSGLLGNVFGLIWNCGVQTILFLAGLQSISPSLYEVSKIEGANKWEEFWLITVPSLRHIISLVLIYTMIELFVDMNNTLVSNAYSRMLDQDYGTSSAMLWFYFLIVLILIGTVYMLYQRFCIKHWE